MTFNIGFKLQLKWPFIVVKFYKGDWSFTYAYTDRRSKTVLITRMSEHVDSLKGQA